jgi:hypothetical protein
MIIIRVKDAPHEHQAKLFLRQHHRAVLAQIDCNPAFDNNHLYP